MVAPVAQHVHNAHDAPALQLAQAGANVRAGHSQRLGNFVGGEGPRRNEQQRVHLRHGAVDAPAGAHFTPMENELLGHGGQGIVCGFCMYAHFCTFSTFRNYQNNCSVVKRFFGGSGRPTSLYFTEANLRADQCASRWPLRQWCWVTTAINS